MSIVIIGGNECMKRQYENVCRDYGYSPKVFCKCQSGLKERIGSPDLMILFTHTVSHKMVRCVLQQKMDSTKVIRSHSSSVHSLIRILDENQ